MAVPIKDISAPGTHHESISLPFTGRWYLTARFWKRASVTTSIILSVASLVLSAYASLGPENQGALKGVAVSGIIVNSLSIALSALTSLDWKLQSTTDRQFAEQLCKIAHLHEGDQIIITRKGLESMSSSLQ